MAKPKELNSAWWKKNKGMTVRDQGLGKALKEWEILTADHPMLSRATYEGVNAAVDEIVDAAEKTIKKCNKTMHKESIGYCEDFIVLAKKTENRMKADQKEYEKGYQGFIQERKDVLKEMEKLEKAVDKIPDGNVSLLNAVSERIEPLHYAVSKPKVRLGSYLHGDEIKDGIPWLNKIYKLVKQIRVRIADKLS